MKNRNTYFLALTTIIFATIMYACASDISDFNYKKGILTYFFDNGKRFGEVDIVDNISNRIEKFYSKNEDKLKKTNWIIADTIVKSKFENGYYEEYYSSEGVLISEGLIENNLKQGVWKFYDKKDFSLVQILEYKNGLENGKSKAYWSSGQLKSFSDWIDGEQQGEGVFLFENGVTEERNQVKNGKLHGTSVNYYRSGKVKSIDKYWYDNYYDTCKIFYENGNIKRLQIINFDTINLTSTGKELHYFPNGKLKRNAETKNMKADGEFIGYNESGVVIEHSRKKNNKHHGSCITYYDSGTKKLEGVLKNGFFEGIIKYYNEGGELIKTVNSDNGIAIDSTLY